MRSLAVVLMFGILVMVGAILTSLGGISAQLRGMDHNSIQQTFPVVLVESMATNSEGQITQRFIRWMRTDAPALGSEWQVVENNGLLTLVALDDKTVTPLFTGRVVTVYWCTKRYGR